MSRKAKNNKKDQAENQPDTNEMTMLADKKREIEGRCSRRIEEILKEERCTLGLELQLVPIGENIYKNAGRITVVYSG